MSTNSQNSPPSSGLPNAVVRASLQRSGREQLPLADLFTDHVTYVRALPAHKELLFRPSVFPSVPDIEVFEGTMRLHYGLVRFGERGPSRIYDTPQDVLAAGGLFGGERAYMHFFREGTARYFALEGDAWRPVLVGPEGRATVGVFNLEQLMLPNLFRNT